MLFKYATDRAKKLYKPFETDASAMKLGREIYTKASLPTLIKYCRAPFPLMWVEIQGRDNQTSVFEMHEVTSRDQFINSPLFGSAEYGMEVLEATKADFSISGYRAVIVVSSYGSLGSIKTVALGCIIIDPLSNSIVCNVAESEKQRELSVLTIEVFFSFCLLHNSPKVFKQEKIKLRGDGNIRLSGTDNPAEYATRVSLTVAARNRRKKTEDHGQALEGRTEVCGHYHPMPRQRHGNWLLEIEWLEPHTRLKRGNGSPTHRILKASADFVPETHEEETTFDEEPDFDPKQGKLSSHDPHP